MPIGLGRDGEALFLGFAVAAAIAFLSLVLAARALRGRLVR